MDIDIEAESIDRLAEHARIPIAFVVDGVLEVAPVDGGPGGLMLRGRTVGSPWTKDYDAVRGGRPAGPNGSISRTGGC